MTSVTVAMLARAVGGVVHGDSAVAIAGAGPLDSCLQGELAYLASDKQMSDLSVTRAAAVLVGPGQLVAVQFRRPDLTVIEVAEPQLAFTDLLVRFRPADTRPPRTISPAAHVSPTAQIGPDCYVGPGAFIGDGVTIGRGCDIYPGVFIGTNTQVGEDVTFFPNSVIYHHTLIGDRVIIHATAVIGADGFGYRFAQGRYNKVPQLGSVRIEDDVEIGAGTTVDRAAIGVTVIGVGTKLDNQVQIGHNCVVGPHNVFASQVGLAGSCVTGSYVRLGGGVGVKDHCHLGNGSAVGAKGGVHKDIPAGETWFGYLATPENEQKRLMFSLKRVPDMREEIKALRSQLTELTAQLGELQRAANRQTEWVAPQRAAG